VFGNSKSGAYAEACPQVVSRFFRIFDLAERSPVRPHVAYSSGGMDQLIEAWWADCSDWSWNVTHGFPPGTTMASAPAAVASSTCFSWGRCRCRGHLRAVQRQSMRRVPVPKLPVPITFA
jgi:hypothetical protein